MGAIAPVLGVIATIGGAYMQYKSQSEAAAAQEDAARESQRLAEINALSQERETEQQAENLREAQKQEEAMNRARAAASGVAVGEGGSLDLYMKEQKQTNREQLEWLKQSGRNRADIIRRGGQSAYLEGMSRSKQTQYGGYGSLFGGAQGAYNIGSQAGWF